MPTLENIHGGSLVGDTSNLNKLLLETFGTKQSREKERVAREKEEALQRDIGALFGEDPASGIIIDERGATGDMSKRLSRISDLASPQVAQQINAALQSDNPVVLDDTQKEAEKGLSVASAINKETTFAGKRRALREQANQAAIRGEDVGRFIELSNLPEERLGMELQKMEIIGNDIVGAAQERMQGLLSTPERRAAFARVALNNPQVAEVLRKAEETRLAGIPKKAETFTDIFDKEGNLLGQRSSTGLLKANPLATKPATTIGKINRDLESGKISQSQADSLLAKELQDPNNEAAFLQELQREKIKTLQDIELRKNDPVEQLKIQQLNQSIVKGEAQIAETAETKKKANRVKEDAARLVDELLDNEDGIRSFVGPIDQLSGDFALGEKTLNAKTKINQLLNILTADNLGIMTGVLSESDIKIIQGIAGGGLDVSGSEDSFINELKRMRSSLKGEAQASPDAEKIIVDF